MTNERRSSNEGKTVVACFLGLGHLDFLCPSSFVLRHFRTNLNAPKKSISLS
jgi:hypothetical protein